MATKGKFRLTLAAAQSSGRLAEFAYQERGTAVHVVALEGAFRKVISAAERKGPASPAFPEANSASAERSPN